jgi:hypothetical protein
MANKSKEAEERVSPRAAIVHEAIRQEGADELERPSSALFHGVALSSARRLKVDRPLRRAMVRIMAAWGRLELASSKGLLDPP